MFLDGSQSFISYSLHVQYQLTCCCLSRLFPSVIIPHCHSLSLQPEPIMLAHGPSAPSSILSPFSSCFPEADESNFVWHQPQKENSLLAVQQFKITSSAYYKLLLRFFLHPPAITPSNGIIHAWKSLYECTNSHRFWPVGCLGLLGCKSMGVWNGLSLVSWFWVSFWMQIVNDPKEIQNWA